VNTADISLGKVIPLALDSGSFDALLERVKIVAAEILTMNSDTAMPARFPFSGGATEANPLA